MNKDKTNQEIIEGFKRRNTRIIFSKKIDPDNIPAFNQAMAHNAAAPRLLGRKIAAKGDTYHNYIAKAAKKRKDQTPSPRIARKDNVTVSSALSRLNNSFNHGLDEGRYERLRAADIKRNGYTELPGRSDPKRAAVFNANTRRIARDRRLAGIVPGSPNARPENRSDVLIHSARKSAEKRAAGKPSPRIPRKNRDRTIADSFNHGLEEAKRPTTPKRPIKQSKNIFGAAARGAISGMQTPKPAGTSGTKHVLKHAVRNMARHVMDKFL